MKKEKAIKKGDLKKNKELEDDLKKMITFEEPEFRKAVIGCIAGLEQAIFEAQEWGHNQRAMIAKVFGKKFKIIDKDTKQTEENFRVIIETLNDTLGLQMTYRKKSQEGQKVRV